MTNWKRKNNFEISGGKRKKKIFVKYFRNPQALMVIAHIQTAASWQTVIGTKPLFTVHWTYSFEILTCQCRMCKKAEQKWVPTKKILCLIFSQGDCLVYFFSCFTLATASCTTGEFQKIYYDKWRLKKKNREMCALLSFDRIITNAGLLDCFQYCIFKMALISSP